MSGYLLITYQVVLGGSSSDEKLLFRASSLTLNDSFQREEDYQENPRQTALEAIAQQYPDHP
ncbi:MAG: hypothetical protein F6K08_28450 [Okeania sp. SIO1H6]|nr:hypothetical protein [Okeania sp. SIO1H6]